MRIETDRLVCRSFTIQDLDPFALMQGDPEVMRYIGGPLTTDASTAQLMEIIQLDQESGLARFAVERKCAEGLIGYCGFKPAGEFVDLGYQYAKKYWGLGFGLEAAKAVREYGLLTLGLTNMEAGGSVENIASIRIMEQLGFSNREELLFDGKPAVRFFD